MSGCSVEGCDGTHKAKGLCRRHYKIPSLKEPCTYPECVNLKFSNGYCRGHYAQLNIRGWLAPIGSNAHLRPDRERFEKKTQPNHETGCLMWTGARTKAGYGKMGWNDGTVDAHRIAWELDKGPIPPGLEVCHRCDVRLCVNINHLFLGTRLDNMADAVAKGRTIKSKKLKAGDADAIRAMYAEGKWTMTQVGERFGITASYVCNIVKGREPRVAA